MTQNANPVTVNLSTIPKILSSYVRSNRFSLACLTISVILAFTKIVYLSSRDSWKNWEFCAIGFTVVYTFYIYGKAWKKNMFDHIPGRWSLLLGVTLTALLAFTAVIANEVIYLFAFNVGRIFILICLVIITLLFSLVDYVFSLYLVSPMPDLGKSYSLSLRFSDLPIAFAFVILTIYALILNFEGHLKDMDAFFGGTIAFQMMLSNIIWTLTDDAFLKKT